MDEYRRITRSGGGPAEKRGSLRSPGDINDYFSRSRYPRGMDDLNSVTGDYRNIYLMKLIAQARPSTLRIASLIGLRLPVIARDAVTGVYDPPVRP